MSSTSAAGKLGVLWWMAGYVAVLLWSTTSLIAPAFAYLGYVQRDVTVMECVVALGASAAICLTLPARCRRPSEVAQLFLVVTVAMPVVWIPLLYGPLSATDVHNLALGVAGAFLAIGLMLSGQRRSLTPLRVSATTFWLMLVLFFLVAMAYLASLGITPRIGGFADVYSQRARFKANIDSVGAYLVGWLAGGTLPIILAVGLHRRSKRLIAIALLGVGFLYSITGYRSYAIGLAVLVGVYVMTRKGVTDTWRWLSLLSGAIVAVGLLDRFTGGISFTSIVVRRGLSTAGINTAYYVDLFKDGPYYELRHSVLSFLGPSPYDAPPGRIVGQTYYWDNTAANANFIGDGFANFGWIGVIGAGVVVGLLLRTYDRLSHGLPLGITAPALVFVLMAMANTAILTVVATHGAAILLGWIALLAASMGAAQQRRIRSSSSGQDAGHVGVESS